MKKNSKKGFGSIIDWLKNLTPGQFLLVVFGALFGLALFAGILMSGLNPQKATPQTEPPKVSPSNIKKVSEKETVPFETVEEEDPSLLKGETKVKQEGAEGEKVVTYAEKYEDGELKSRKKVNENVTKEPKNKIVLVGTLEGEKATVTRVIDGDTIEVKIDGRTERVRYIGINTPETYQSYGSEATAKNKELVGTKEVRLIKDVSERDKYGRLLRYVYAGDLFVNAELVKQGYANAATYPPDVKHADLFVQLEREARDKQVGLWAPAPEPEPQTAPKTSPGPSGETVYITKTGKKYHRGPECHSYLSKSKIPINMSNAIAQGYEACGCGHCNW